MFQSIILHALSIKPTKYMKSILSILLVTIFALGASAQEKSKWTGVDASNLDAEYYPAQSAWRNYLQGEDRNMTPKIKLLYSRPLKKDRDIFGALIPYGKEWRLGANEANEITFYQAVDIGGTTINRGTYTMFATPNENDWTITFSSQRGLWGAANRDASKTVASMTVPSSRSDQPVEMLSMAFREIDEQTAHLTIQWDRTKVELPIAFNPVLFSGADKSPMDMVTYPEKAAYTNYLEGSEKEITPKVQVLYSRPYKKDRVIFGELLKVGDIWRVGANQSTELVLMQDAMVGDLELKRGRYAVYAELMEGSWDMIFSTDLPAWGNANRDESKDVGRTNIKTYNEDEVLENLTIIFEEKASDKVHMSIGWDTTRAELPITFK